MDENLIYQAIFRRKSVRKFESSPLDQETIAGITSQFSLLTPMLEGIRTEVTLMTSGSPAAGWTSRHSSTGPGARRSHAIRG